MGFVVSGGMVGFQGEASMDAFKQYWNAVWHFQTPEDPGVLWFHETFGDFPMMTAFIAILMTGFIAYLWCLDYFYIQKPEAKFQEKLLRVQETGDLSIFDEE